MSTLVDEPPRDLLFRRRIRLGESLRELWNARELVRTLAERDIRARYKQQVIGLAWAVILPVVLMIVFTLFVKKVAHVHTPGIPYPLFSYVGLVPYGFFSSSVSGAGTSVITNNSLVNKIYCPREVFPLASLATAAFDTVISAAVLAVLFGIFTFMPRPTAVFIPVLVVVQTMFVTGVALILAAATVYFRDLRSVLPLFLQLALFATPVAYPVRIQGGLRFLYALANPLAPVIDGYRATLLSGTAPDWASLGVAAASSTALLLFAYLLFKRLETGFADVA